MGRRRRRVLWGGGALLPSHPYQLVLTAFIPVTVPLLHAARLVPHADWSSGGHWWGRGYSSVIFVLW